MPIGRLRDKVLYGILAKQKGTHRYTLVRWVVGILFTVLVALLPLLGILRFDFWGGRHTYLGEELGLVEVTKAFAFPFLAINILIVVVSRFYGRYLCGFVCPVGSLARLGEWARFKSRTGKVQVLGPIVVFLVCALLTAITFSFFVDWRVFIEGSSRAVWLSAGFLGATQLFLFGACQFMGLRFCRDWCPSGVYFALLGHKTANGIEFAHPETCIDCDLCDKACPMDLAPREMSGGEFRDSCGLYGESMSNFALCIRCGDCVLACEAVTAKKPGATPLRMGTLPPGARDSRDGGAARDAEAAAAESEPDTGSDIAGVA